MALLTSVLCRVGVLEPDESHLLQRSREGDLDAFNAIVLRYQGLVYNLCLRLLSSREAAEDAAQDAFIAAYRALPAFRGTGPGRAGFRAWLLRIAANACYDELRRRRARPAVPLGAAGSGDRPLDPAAPVEPLDERAQRQELARYLQQALAALPFDQRLAVVLRDVQGLSYEEIAQATRSSLGTVKSRIARGRDRLRHLLLRQRELLPDPFRRLSEG